MGDFMPDIEMIERMLQTERYAWLSLTHDMGAVISIDGRFEDANTQWGATTGYDQTALLGSYLVEYMHFDDRERALAELQALITADVSSTSVVFRFLCADGTYTRLSWSLMFSPEYECFFCTVRNGNESQTDRAVRYAYKDVLTGLGNRLYLMDSVPCWLHDARASKQQVAVCFLDLDGFKQVNDTFGHKVGDQLLKKVAERLLECVPQQDGVVRLGGDEFVLVLRNVCSRDGLSELLRELIASVNSPASIEGRECSVGVSVGVSFFPEDGATLDELVQAADDAMYGVKRGGKNNFSFHLPASSNLGSGGCDA